MWIGHHKLVTDFHGTFVAVILFSGILGTLGSDGIDYGSSYGSLFPDSSCSAATPSSLGWRYGVFGNATFSQVLKKVQQLQIPTDVRFFTADSKSASCYYGICDPTTSSCKCSRNWSGAKCSNCVSRTLWNDREQGYLSSSVAGYGENSRCTWIVAPPPTLLNASLQLRLLNFSTECSWDLLFIFDGSAAIPSNLLAVISGDLTAEQLNSYPVIYSKLGSVLIYFYSDAFLNYGGFLLEYTFSQCPRNCSGHGECSIQPLTSTYVVTYSNGSMSSIPVTTTSSPYFATTPDSVGPSPVAANAAKCRCYDGYNGLACEQLNCPNSCSFGNGKCLPDGTCRCNLGFAGIDCSINVAQGSGYWNVVPVQSGVSDNNRAPAAGGVSVLVKSDDTTVTSDAVWLFGGFDFSTRFNTFTIRKFDLALQSFSNIVTGNAILNRYGHSVVLRKDWNVVYIFGGTLTWSNRVTSELVLFNMTSLNYTVLNGGRISSPIWKSQPSALTGHTAHLVDSNRMFVFFGYSPDYGLSDWVRLYTFNNNSWSVYQTPFGGRAWHSSVYDALSNSVYVYGGFAASHTRSSVDITGDLLQFDVDTYSWIYIDQLPFRRAFHAAILLPSFEAGPASSPIRHLLVHGGTMHETAASTRKSQLDSGLCYVASPFVFDLDSGCATQLSDTPSAGQLSTFRLGHSAVIYNSSVIYFGGFDGTVVDQRLIQFTPLPCEMRGRAEDCAVLNGFTCKWVCGQCYSLSATVPPQENCSSTVVTPLCSYQSNMTNGTIPDAVCNKKTSCTSCINFDPTSEDYCQWLAGELCISVKQTATTTSVQDLSRTDYSDSVSSLIQMQSLVKDPDQCPTSCNSLTDCASCAKQTSCLWCNTLALCLSSDAYRIAFPYGQCQDWTMNPDTCRTNCSSYRSCSDCQQDLRCGWCDDGSGTGTGTCMVGGLKSAFNTTTSNMGCPVERWYFSTCPLCQCSGHSTCYNGTSECKSCGDNTQGKNCESCVSGYFGSALNGGICQSCQCNDHATVCDNVSGYCKCDTQGISGPHCDQCDRNYEGDAIWGTCYYPIQSGYRYTMDLTKKDMQYINKINFQTKEKLGRNEVNFKLNCTKLASYTLSYAIGAMVNSSETLLQSGSCGPDLPIVEISVSPTGNVPFSEPNFRFRIAISNFTYPFLITLVATEEQPFLIYLLLIAVFGCFLVVLVIAIIVFQIKRRYDDYHRRQQVKIELRRMAKRPFAMINFLIVHPYSYGSSSGGSGSGGQQSAWGDVPQQPPVGQFAGDSSRKMMMSNMVSPFQPRAPPMPVTLQPLAVPGAAIMTVLIQLPLSVPASSGSNESEVPLGAPSALAAGSVVVRAASNLLSDLSNRGRQPLQQSTTTSAASENTLCASSAATQLTSSGRGTGIASNDVLFNESVSPVVAPSRRSSRQTCWNTPPVNNRQHGSASAGGGGLVRATSASTAVTISDIPGAASGGSFENNRPVSLRAESQDTSF